MAKLTWIKWYWSDWRSDPGLRNCSLSARGLWAEMLAIMSESDPIGFLKINGAAVSDEHLSKQVGAPQSQVSPLVEELESNGVFSRNKAGVIYSRKMNRDRIRRESSQNHGRKGGNPALLKQRQKPDTLNLPLTPGVNPQRLETRDQSLETNKETNKDYAFLGSVIRLNQEHFDTWKNLFGNIELRVELTRYDHWLDGNCSDKEKKGWFKRTFNRMASLNQAAKERVESQVSTDGWEPYDPNDETI